jgi:hypothetical protein
MMSTSNTISTSLHKLPINPRKMPSSLKIAAPASPMLMSALAGLPSDGITVKLDQRETEQDSSDVISTSVTLCQLCPTAWAELLLFSGLQSVGSVAAVSRLFRNCTFEDASFWIAYDGQCCKPSQGLSLLSPSAMRDAVRRRTFGLEGGWGMTFAKLAGTGPHAKTFEEAMPILSGIRPDDDALEAARFIGALVAALGTFDASCPLTRKSAQAVVQHAQVQEDLLPKAAKPFARAATPLKRLQSALQASIDRVAIPELLLDDDLSSSSEEEQEDVTLCVAEKADAVCLWSSRVQTGLKAAALFAGSYAVSALSEVVTDEGLQELAILATVIPAGLAFAWRQRKQASSKSKIMGAKGKLNKGLASLMRL